MAVGAVPVRHAAEREALVSAQLAHGERPVLSLASLPGLDWTAAELTWFTLSGLDGKKPFSEVQATPQKKEVAAAAFCAAAVASIVSTVTWSKSVGDALTGSSSSSCTPVFSAACTVPRSHSAAAVRRSACLGRQHDAVQRHVLDRPRLRESHAAQVVRHHPGLVDHAARRQRAGDHANTTL